MNLYLTIRYPRQGHIRFAARLCVVASSVFLSACGGGDSGLTTVSQDSSVPSVVNDGSESGARIAVGKLYSYKTRLPLPERLPTGIQAYTAELIQAGLHPANAFCAVATKLISTAQFVLYPVQEQVILFTIPVSETERASALGYSLISAFDIAYNPNNPQPCSTD